MRFEASQPAQVSGILLMTARGCAGCPVQIKQVEESLRFAIPCNEK